MKLSADVQLASLALHHFVSTDSEMICKETISRFIVHYTAY